MKIFRATFTNGQQEILWATDEKTAIGVVLMRESARGASSWRELALLHEAETPVFEGSSLGFISPAAYRRPDSAPAPKPSP